MTGPDRWTRLAGTGAQSVPRLPGAARQSHPPTSSTERKPAPGLGERRQANRLQGTGARPTGARPEEGARPFRPSRLHLPHARKHATRPSPPTEARPGREASSDPFLPSRSPRRRRAESPSFPPSPCLPRGGFPPDAREARLFKDLRARASPSLGLSPSLLRRTHDTKPGLLRPSSRFASVSPAGPGRRGEERSGRERRAPPGRTMTRIILWRERV